MNLLMLALHDSVAAAFITPFFVANEAIAIRQLRQEVNREGSNLGANPGDYSLYNFGQWEDNKGLMEQNIPPRLVCNLSTLKEAK